MQVPGLLGRAHDWQTPLQALLQQTPWAQTPLPHSLLLTQAAPSGLTVTQAPLLQVPVAQSLFAWQLVKHCSLLLQTNGAHDWVVAGAHTPAPSQVRAEVCCPAAQVAGAHTVAGW